LCDLYVFFVLYIFVLGTGEDSLSSNPQSCSVSP